LDLSEQPADFLDAPNVPSGQFDDSESASAARAMTSHAWIQSRPLSTMLFPDPLRSVLDGDCATFVTLLSERFDSFVDCDDFVPA
jgi:hypothetical protein